MEDLISRQAVINLVNAECVDLQDGSEEWRSYVNETVENIYHGIESLPPVRPTQNWIPLVWDEYPTVDSDGNDDYVYAVDYSVPMPKEDEWVLVTDENHSVVKVQYDGYDFGDYAREDILAWSPLPKPYEEK